MPKDAVTSVRDGLAQIASAVNNAMTAPDAGPLLPMLAQLHQQVIQVIQMGSRPGMPPTMPPGGMQQQRPGPPAQTLPNAGGQGLFPNSPQPNADELRALLGGRAGM